MQLRGGIRFGFSVMAVTALLSFFGWLDAPLPTAAAASQESTGLKAVDVEMQNRMDAVTIESVMVNGRQVQPGTNVGPREIRPGALFEAGNDWLGGMTLVLRNRTNKKISEIELELLFPDTGDGQSRPVTTYMIDLGRRPDKVSYVHLYGTPQGNLVYRPQPPDKKPLNFSPGQTLTVRIGDYISEIKSAVEHMLPLSEITRVGIRLEVVYCDDGMRWDDLVGFSIFNLDQKRYMDLGRRYFPGDPKEYWPPGNLQTQP